MTVSILMALYNEEEFVGVILQRVLSAPLPDGLDREIIVVDDGSADGSARIVEERAARHPDTIRLIRHDRNRGKGAAIRTALQQARGEFSIIQDADLEYDPREYPKLLKPLLEGSADAVFGSRFLISGERRVLYYWHALANHFLTTACNIAANLNLTDMETCYKAFRTSLVQSIPIRCDRFGIEPEITIKLAKRQARIYETPISYHGRTYEEGKKIGLWDAIKALAVILRFWGSDDIYAEPGQAILDAFAHTPRFNGWMADTIRPYVGKCVLEIGAGMGNLTRQLIPGRQVYIATDIDEEHMSRLRVRLYHRANLEVYRCDAANTADFAPFAGRMDTVICLNVLEHVPEDWVTLANIHLALIPGGRAIILVPQDQKIYGAMDEALGHVLRYSKQQLRSRIEEAGFTVVQILNFNRASWPGWYITGKLLKKRTLSRLQLRLFEKLVWLWRRIDTWLPWPSVSIIAICVKR
jgi:SAM-dependent methyltransferase